MPAFVEYQKALQRCMEAEPPIGYPLPYILSCDSSQLANVFVEMVYANEMERPLEALTQKQREAFDRWSS